MIFNFTSSNIINSFLRFLGVMPKYWCMELLGFLYQTQQDTGGGMNDQKNPYEWKTGTKEKENLNWLLG